MFQNGCNIRYDDSHITTHKLRDEFLSSLFTDVSVAFVLCFDTCDTPNFSSACCSCKCMVCTGSIPVGSVSVVGKSGDRKGRLPTFDEITVYFIVVNTRQWLSWSHPPISYSTLLVFDYNLFLSFLKLYMMIYHQLRWVLDLINTYLRNQCVNEAFSAVKLF